MKRIFLLIFATPFFQTEAQVTDSVKQRTDSIEVSVAKKDFKYYFGRIPLKTLHQSRKFDVQIDTRNSFVKDFPINVYGANVGIILKERFRLSAGYYWINQNFNDKLLGINSSTGKVVVTPKGIPIPVATLDQWVAEGKIPAGSYVKAAQQIDLWFTSVGFMYTFYASRLVEFAIPIEIGYGRFSEKLYDVSGNDFGSLSTSLKPGTTQGSFVPGQIGFNMLIKPHRWAYLDASIGYRQTLIQNYDSKYRATSFDSQFNGEYYNVGVKIQLGTIVKEWREHRKKKSKGNAPSIIIKE